MEKRDLFTTLTQIIRRHRLENMHQLIDFCEKYQVELDLPNIDILNYAMGADVGMTELYFDESIRTNNCNGTKPNMVLVAEEN